MAYAYPKFTSGEGNILDRDGVLASEKFIVVLDDVKDDFVDVLQNRIQTDPWGRTGVPIGSRHPRSNWSRSRVIGYQATEQIEERTVEAIVIYSSDLASEGLYGGWNGVMRFQTASERIGRALDIVGPDGTIQQFGKTIGTPWLRLARDDDNQLSQIFLADNPDTGQRMNFVIAFNPDGTPATRREPFDRLRIDGVMEFSKIVPRFSFAMFRGVKAIGGRVNKSTWNGFKPRTLLFSDFGSQETIYTPRGTNVPQRGFEVATGFLYNESGFTPHRLVTTYTDPESSAELVVVNVSSNLPAEVSFDVYYEAEFSSIFSTLETSGPKDPSRTVST